MSGFMYANSPFRYKSLAKGAIAGYYLNSGGGTGTRNQYRYGDGTRTMTTTNKRRRPNPRSSFKQLMLKNTAAKHKTANPSTAMTHNTMYTYNVTGQIVQGDSNQDRDGDSINLEALKLRGFFDTSATAGAYSFRIIVGYSGEEYAATNFTTVGLTSGEVFLPNASNNFTGVINPKAFTVIFDSNVDINSQVAGASDISSMLKTISLKRKFPYQATASVFGKDVNLYVVVVGYVVGGVAGVTAVGEVSLATDCIFK